MQFTDKVILITGGAGGIGQALGRTFLDKGAKICICDINEVEGKKVLNKLQTVFGAKRAIFVKCDVTKDEDFKAAYDECEIQLGTIDILINNAGILTGDLKTIMSINFESVVRGTELALKRMGKHNGGQGGIVVNVGSEIGAARLPFFPYYSSSKAAVIHFTRCIGHEFHYGYSGVHILCLCPAIVDTPLTESGNFLKESYNTYTNKALKESTSIFIKMAPTEVAEAAIQLIEDKKPGSALCIQKGVRPYYVSPSLLTEF